MNFSELRLYLLVNFSDQENFKILFIEYQDNSNHYAFVLRIHHYVSSSMDQKMPLSLSTSFFIILMDFKIFLNNIILSSIGFHLILETRRVLPEHRRYREYRCLLIFVCGKNSVFFFAHDDQRIAKSFSYSFSYSWQMGAPHVIILYTILHPESRP